MGRRCFDVVKAILKKVGHDAEVVEVENKICVFEEMVGGDFWTMPFASDVIFFCNKQVMQEGKEINFPIPYKEYDNVCGDVLFVGNGGHIFRGLTDGEINAVLGILNAKEE